MALDTPTPDRPVTRIVVMDQIVSPVKPTARVQTRRITMLPGIAAGPHVHNGPVFGTIERGAVVFQIRGEAETVLHAGDVFHEPEDVVIERFDALADGATFLGFFLVDDGQEPTLSPVPLSG